MTDHTVDRLSAGPDSLFHPAVARWFARRFPAGPTPPQAGAWPHIAAGRDVLVASPTGSGKTLTGFLVAIDAAYRAAARGARPGGVPEVLYISPLRALAVDVHENLHVPLDEIRREAAALGCPDPGLRVAVRTGDTPPAERAAMHKHSPDLLVTTPESLYLLLTASTSRRLLRGVRTVIVDEVHTLARDKRGSHLALSLERLDALVGESGGRLQRIGLSATQRPLDVVARLLTGVHDGRPPPVVVDCGHARDLEVSIELPASELEAVMSGGQMSDILDRIAEHTRHHRTTLVFVNTRKMAERVAHQLAERLADDGMSSTLDGGGLSGEDVDASLRVAAHHGSLSAARRRIVETRLRAGDLRALVATASLELGIDVGPVELVCQIGSPRAIGTFLQRVGRANHHRDGTPAGRLYPTTRDELVECTALLAAVREGRLDLLEPPVAPLDVLTQQLVAEVAAAGECDVEELWAMTRRAAPYADLDRAISTRWSRWPAGVSRPGAAAGAPTSTMTPSTGGCAPGAGHAWPRSPGVVPFPRPATTGWCSTPRASPSDRCTRTSPSRPPRATSSCSGPTRGGWPRWRWARCASTTPVTSHRPSRSGWARHPPARQSCPRR